MYPMAIDKTKASRYGVTLKSRDYIGSRRAVTSSFGIEKPASSRPPATKD